MLFRSWIRLSDEILNNTKFLDLINQYNFQKEFGLDLKNEDFVIFGTGDMTKLILEKSILLKNNNLLFITDSYISEDFEQNGILYKKLQSLFESNCKIIIAATQSYPLIYKKLISLGIPFNRIYSNLVI